MCLMCSGKMSGFLYTGDHADVRGAAGGPGGRPSPFIPLRDGGWGSGGGGKGCKALGPLPRFSPRPFPPPPALAALTRNSELRTLNYELRTTNCFCDICLICSGNPLPLLLHSSPRAAPGPRPGRTAPGCQLTTLSPQPTPDTYAPLPGTPPVHTGTGTGMYRPPAVRRRPAHKR